MRHFESDRGWRRDLFVIIFEADTRGGKAFDVALIATVLASVGVVMLESIDEVRETYGRWLVAAEWAFTILFTIEYTIRLIVVERPRQYAASFFGVVDLLAILPTYLSVVVPGSQYLLVVRLLRILRVFRVLKLVEYLNEADVLVRAMRASQRKITVFIFTVLTLVVILGSLMYLVEGSENGFTSIPVSVYWAIVTLTTVGYGDISPQTGLGQALAAMIMLMGYGIIAVPTGIVTAELTRVQITPQGDLQRVPVGASRGDPEGEAQRGPAPDLSCPRCGADGHPSDAAYCRRCGGLLD